VNRAAYGAGNRRRGGAFFHRPAVELRGLFGEKEFVVKAGKIFRLMGTAKFMEPGKVIGGKALGGEEGGGPGIKAGIKDQEGMDFGEGLFQFFFRFKKRFYFFVRRGRRIPCNITCNIIPEEIFTTF
jgi:hypothetical protein